VSTSDGSSQPSASEVEPLGTALGSPPAQAGVSQSVIDSVVDADTVVEKIDIELAPALRSVVGGRHEARERAVHLLYEAEMKGLPIEAILKAQVLIPDPYTEKLLRKVEEHRAQLTELIGRLARGWSVERMPTLDLALLRVACCELAYCPEVPRGVVLSEAVALAGQYGTDDSSKFVNGLLTAAADELRPA